MADRTTNRILLLLLALLLTAPATAGRLYKWVDDDGNVHYGSQIPPEFASQESEVLNEQAVTLEVRDRERTDDELAAAAETRRQQAAQQRASDAQTRADRVLLDSYASVQDMETARESRISALEAQVNVTAGRISSLQQTLIDIEEQITTTRNSGREPAPELLAELDLIRSQLLDNQRFLQARRDEQDNIRARFAADIAHYLELKGEGAQEGTGGPIR